MNIDTLGFAGFCALVLLGAQLVPVRRRNASLLAASYAFYASWSPGFVGLLLGVTAFNYALAPRLRDGNGRPRPLLLWLGIGANLAVLAAFRYADFFVPELLALLARLGWTGEHGVLPILIPVGLSFYALQALAYLVDVYRGQVPACKRPVDFALYLAWFPKLTAGPIERAEPFLKQLARPSAVDADAIKAAFTLILIGLVRKLVIADTLLGAVPEALTEDPGSLGARMLLIWLAVFAVGLYNDFAGYTAIARGVSRLFGIELSRNFAQPLFATNYAAFWSRWHMTLSFWLRDYIYFPVSRALLRRWPGRTHPANLLLPPVLTMVASGWWHGVGWSFLVWGLLMGLYQVAERLITMNRPILPAAQRPWWQPIAGWALTFTTLMIAVPLFLAPVPQALAAWQTLLSPKAWALPIGPEWRVALLMLPPVWLDWVQLRGKDELAFLSWPEPARVGLTAFALLAIFLFTRMQTAEPFIYQGF